MKNKRKKKLLFGGDKNRISQSGIFTFIVSTPSPPKKKRINTQLKLRRIRIKRK